MSGENVLGVWTEHKKREILSSRVLSTRLLATTFSKFSHKPSLFICASGMNYYGHDSRDQIVDESSPKGHGFLADTCYEWENETSVLSNEGVRVVFTRFGLIMDPSGG